ncbi:MAG: DNA repair protein RadC [Tannerella sp.]|jgi:DNA repair protein RadC|nr:DNA repair protein RadC [Tannerella sp.]
MDSDGRLRIREWAAEDRPREKTLLKGISALSDAELLAILIGSGNDSETAVQLSQRILHSVSNNLNALGKRSVKDLMTFRGIGEAKAISIAAAMELGRRRNETEPLARESIRSSAQVFHLFRPLLCDLPYEECWVVLTNQSAKVIEKVKVSQGGVSGTAADIRLILKVALNALASGIALCHNHPSGNPQPSPTDDVFTFRVQKAAQTMGILLLDHVILCDHTYYSYADEERLNNESTPVLNNGK